MFEVKTNVQTKQVVSKMRIKKKLQEDMGLINPDKHNSHDITDNLDPSTFVNPTERQLSVKLTVAPKNRAPDDDDLPP